MTDLPGSIRAQRMKDGLNQVDLGTKLGVSESTVSRWERGEQLNALRPTQIVELATWLDTKPSTVLFAIVAHVAEHPEQ